MASYGISWHPMASHGIPWHPLTWRAISARLYELGRIDTKRRKLVIEAEAVRTERAKLDSDKARGLLRTSPRPTLLYSSSSALVGEHSP
jgi:hypothetical protein